eukprot:COSAG02_NODE_9515_length_2190_cov_6.867527_1_plen_87_part_00
MQLSLDDKRLTRTSAMDILNYLCPGIRELIRVCACVSLSACSLLSRTTYKSASTDAVPLIWFENIWGYFEVNAIVPRIFRGQLCRC